MRAGCRCAHVLAVSCAIALGQRTHATNSEHHMKEIEVGMKIDMKAGPSLFGLEQVNAALKAGARVVSVREGAVITSKVGEDAADVELAMTGFAVKLMLDET